jgi:hypothetical protein
MSTSNHNVAAIVPMGIPRRNKYDIRGARCITGTKIHLNRCERQLAANDLSRIKQQCGHCNGEVRRALSDVAKRSRPMMCKQRHTPHTNRI